MGYKGTPLSSLNQDWETPPKLVEYIENKFQVNFTLDAAATADNAKAFSFITAKEDALSCHWYSYGGAVWLNPPFGRGGKGQRLFIQKAIEETKSGRAKQVFALIPARTDTKMFHEDILPNASALFFIKSRIYYKRGADRQMCAPFPAMLVIFEHRTPKPLETLLRNVFTLDIPIEERRWFK